MDETAGRVEDQIRGLRIWTGFGGTRKVPQVLAWMRIYLPPADGLYQGIRSARQQNINNVRPSATYDTPGSSRKLWERQNLTGREASTPIGTRTDTTLEPMPSCTDKSGCTVCKPSTLTGRLVTAEHDRLESGANAVEGLMGRSPRYRLLCPRQQCGTDIDALRCRCTPPIQQRHGYPAGDTYLDLARFSIPIPPSPGREAVD
jgi:hypothetical protein